MTREEAYEIVEADMRAAVQRSGFSIVVKYWGGVWNGSADARSMSESSRRKTLIELVDSWKGGDA